MDVTRLQERSYLKIAILYGRNARECDRELVEAVRNNDLPCRTVARWIDDFQRRREATSDLQRVGRYVSVRTDVSYAVLDP